ncbi:MAG: 3'-5' exonuclease, partial [Gemmatimonadota bacterium]|nr:3'-5' exonuclease [Gemmatimonadota bacterium]
ERPELMSYAAGMVAELHREVPGATVGVLVRRNRTVARLIHELRRHGIEASEEGGTTVDDAAPVAALLALLRLADHPGHRIARYHVAATPLGAVVDYTDYQDDGAARRLAARIRTRLVSEGYGPMLSSLVEELAPSVSPPELRRLEQLVELGFRWAGRSTLRPGDFVRFVESEKVEDPLSMPVRVMTVHQAKGLEFDVVVLPELDDSISRGEVKTALPERDPDTGRVRKVFPAVDAALRPLFPEMETALTQNRDDAIRDELSWLYVAVTRARFALHLLMGERRGSSTAKTFARLVTAAVGRQGEDVAEGRVLFESGDRAWHREVEGVEEGPAPPAPEEIELRIDPAAPRTRLFAQRTPSTMESGGRVDPAGVLRVETVGALRRGEVVHRWCEEVGWIEEGLPTVDRLHELARGVAPAMGRPEVERLAREYRRWMEDPSVSEILERDAAEVRLARLADGIEEVGVVNERPFAVRRDDEVVSGVIDRLVLARDGDGEVIAAELVDYKTDRLDPGDEQAIAERLDAYRPQLRAYRDAVARIHRLEASSVTARLLFLEAGAVWTIER